MRRRKKETEGPVSEAVWPQATNRKRMTGGSGSFFSSLGPAYQACVLFLFMFDFARLYVYRADDGSFVVGRFFAPKALFAGRFFVDLAQAVLGACV